MVIAVAIDEAIDEVRVLADGITYPVLMDPDHLLTEMYAISNVPAVIWIDEKGSNRPSQRQRIRQRYVQRVHRPHL